MVVLGASRNSQQQGLVKSQTIQGLTVPNGRHIRTVDIVIMHTGPAVRIMHTAWMGERSKYTLLYCCSQLQVQMNLLTHDQVLTPSTLFF